MKMIRFFLVAILSVPIGPCLNTVDTTVLYGYWVNRLMIQAGHKSLWHISMSIIKISGANFIHIITE